MQLKGDADPTGTRVGYFVICRNNAAQCAMNLSAFESAITYASEALAKDSKNFKALYRRGKSRVTLASADVDVAMEYGENAFDDLSLLALDERSAHWERGKNRCIL